jgi:predicted RNase H-like nuclease (RuvC/YqgF family)
MSVLKLKQLQYETESWKRWLGFITDENIHLKNRLSEILKDNFDTNLLEEIEIFQTHFIKEDDQIHLLRNEVADLDTLLVREIFENGTIIRQVDNKLKRLRRNIKKEEAQFTRLKTEFNNYLSENIIQNR